MRIMLLYKPDSTNKSELAYRLLLVLPMKRSMHRVELEISALR